MSQAKYVAALGFFDGVHRGHRYVLNTAANRARELSVKSCAISFDINPKTFFSSSPTQILITPDLSQKETLLKSIGNIDDVFFLHFDETLANTEYTDFVKNILIEKYNVCHIVFGEDFTCGKNNTGNSYSLLALCYKLGIGCDIIGFVNDSDGKKISSSSIRKLIHSGNAEAASDLLGYSI